MIGRHRHNVLNLSILSSEHSFVCLHPNLWTQYFENELFWCQLERGPRGKGIKWSTLGSGGQSSRSHEGKGRLGGLAEASFLTHFGQEAFLVITRHAKLTASVLWYCWLCVRKDIQPVRKFLSNLQICSKETFGKPTQSWSNYNKCWLD